MSENKTVSIRLPEKLYQDLKNRANEERRTISAMIEVLVLRGIEAGQ